MAIPKYVLIRECPSENEFIWHTVFLLRGLQRSSLYYAKFDAELLSVPTAEAKSWLPKIR